ncbi:ArsR family transcriptional regulator [Rhodococcus sp. NPDC080181]|uniref:ArsR family transcriptional regulator n=1 Tax=Rhodococcus sp. NPDC080181 TaxID=3155292 RepID=UPI00344C2944
MTDHELSQIRTTLDALREYGPMTPEQIHQRTGKLPDAIDDHLRILSRCRLVERSGAVYTSR